MDNLQKLLQDAEDTVQHFRDHLDPDDPEGKKHVANSNRAFGADCVLDLVKEAVEREQWEYGATYSVNGKDSVSTPTGWSTNIKEAKEDLDWFVNKQKVTHPEREWRIVKRHPRVKLELSDEEKEQLND